MGKNIVRLRYVILAIFIVAIVVACIFFPTMVKRVNYDLTSYLPEGYDTYDGYQYLSENFGIHGDAEIGVSATYTQVNELISSIEAVDGVTSVTWADMLSYLTEFGIFNKTDAEYLKLRQILTDAPADDDGDVHNWAVLVTLKYAPSSPEAIQSFQAIKSELVSAVGENGFAMSGMTEQANALYESVFDEIWLYCIIAGVVVLLILLFTTNSIMEPVILILALLVSIIINLGTNAIFPSTSIITFACSAILQLGLSMDYAIFLLHQYRAELKTTLDPRAALANAIPKSAKSIAASALTTIGGLLALLCMKFGIGSDLGLTLAKGILCSMLTVIFLQPCLMLMCEKARVKTQHRCLDAKFKTPVKHSIKNRAVIAVVFLLALVPIFFASNSLQYAYLKFMPDNGVETKKEEIAKTLGNQIMILVPYQSIDSYTGKNTGYILDEENYRFVNEVTAMGVDNVSFMLGLFVMFPEDKKLSGDLIYDKVLESGNDELAKQLEFLKGKSFDLPALLGFMGLLDNLQTPVEGFDISQIKAYLSNGYTLYTVGINPDISNESQEGFDILNRIKAIAADCFEGNGKCYFTGYSQAAYDFASITPNDFMWVTIVSVLIIFVILVIALSSIKFPVLLVALIELGIWINLALQYVFTGGTINFMSYLIISAVQLGATVDYAILVTGKYRSLRKRFAPAQASYMATTSSAMSIVTSALIMSGACFSVYFVTSNLIIKEITFLMARGAIISAILVIFVLPALLTVIDRQKGGEIHIPRTPKLRKYKRASKSARAGWRIQDFGETPCVQSKFSGEEMYELMHDGVDINSKSDAALRKILNRR